MQTISTKNFKNGKDCCNRSENRYLCGMQALWHEKLRAILELNGDKNQKLVFVTGAKPNRVSRWLRGLGNVGPYPSEWIKISKHWGFTLDELMKPEIELPHDEEQKAIYAPEHVAAVIRRLRLAQKPPRKPRSKAKVARTG